MKTRGFNEDVPSFVEPHCSGGADGFMGGWRCWRMNELIGVKPLFVNGEMTIR